MNWAGELYKYTSEYGVFDCPATTQQNWNRLDEAQDEAIVWCYNREMAGSVVGIAQPSQKVPFWEEGRKMDIAHRCRWTDGPNDFPQNWNDWYVPHDNSYNMPFVDGHVENLNFNMCRSDRQSLADGPY